MESKNNILGDRLTKVFCLVEPSSKEAAIAVHREALRLVADEVIEIQEGKSYAVSPC